MSSTMSGVTLALDIDDPEATFTDYNGEPQVAATAWWTAARYGAEFTAFPGEGRRGCQSWWMGEDDMPEWVPEPPEWFKAVAEELAR